MFIFLSVFFSFIASLGTSYVLSAFLAQEIVIFLVFCIFPLFFIYILIKNDNLFYFFIINLPLGSHIVIGMSCSLLFSFNNIAFADEPLEVHALDIDEGGNGGQGINDNKVIIAADVATNHEEMSRYTLVGDVQKFNKHSRDTGLAKVFPQDVKLSKFHESYMYLHYIYQSMIAPVGTALFETTFS